MHCSTWSGYVGSQAERSYTDVPARYLTLTSPMCWGAFSNSVFEWSSPLTPILGEWQNNHFLDPSEKTPLHRRRTPTEVGWLSVFPPVGGILYVTGSVDAVLHTDLGRKRKGSYGSSMSSCFYAGSWFVSGIPPLRLLSWLTQLAWVSGVFWKSKRTTTVLVTCWEVTMYDPICDLQICWYCIVKVC